MGAGSWQSGCEDIWPSRLLPNQNAAVLRSPGLSLELTFLQPSPRGHLSPCVADMLEGLLLALAQALHYIPVPPLVSCPLPILQTVAQQLQTNSSLAKPDTFCATGSKHTLPNDV